MFKQLPDKTSRAAGQRKYISEYDVVSETVEVISDFGHVLVDCFEFESAPSSIPIAKGKLRAHSNFWSQTLKTNSFILHFIDKGYAIPLMSVPPKPILYGNLFIKELLISGCIIEVPNPSHVVNPLSVSIESTGKKRLILDLRHVIRHVNKHTRKKKLSLRT